MTQQPRRPEMANSDNQLLWLDLETTGLSTLDGKDEIIEIGCILTTQYLDVIGEFTSVVKPSSHAFDRLVANQFVWDMHTKSGLLDNLKDGHPLHVVENDLIRWLGKVATCDRLTLAGSGVGAFDLPTLRVQMPKVAGGLNYYVIDVGVIRRAHEMWVGTPVSAANDAKTHRAMDDVRCHLEDGKAFAALWQRTQCGP